MPALYLSNGRIIELFFDRGTLLATVVYSDGPRGRQTEQTVRLAIDSNTIVLNTNGAPIRASSLSEGIIINAVYSSAMTRSIPPQAAAYFITVVRRVPAETVTTGRILEVDRINRSFTTIGDCDPSSIIRFNASENTVFHDRSGRLINFNRLNPGMRVQVRHANFMTASIPPQTTAFEVRML